MSPLVTLVVEFEARCMVPVVPHHQVVNPPAVGVDELALRGMGDQFVDQFQRLVPGSCRDRAGMASDVEAHAAAVGRRRASTCGTGSKTLRSFSSNR